MSGIYNPGSGSGGAPTGAQYVTLATDGTLTAERVLTAGTTGPAIVLTDAGAGSTITVDIANEQWKSVAGDVGVTNSAVLVDVTGMLIAVAGNSTEQWYFDIMLRLTAAGTGSDYKFGWTVPSGTTMAWGIHSAQTAVDYWGTDTGTSPNALLAAGSTLSIGSSNATNGTILRGFILSGNTSGNVQLQFAQNSATVGQTNTVKAGSVGVFRRTIA